MARQKTISKNLKTLDFAVARKLMKNLDSFGIAGEGTWVVPGPGEGTWVVPGPGEGTWVVPGPGEGTWVVLVSTLARSSPSFLLVFRNSTFVFFQSFCRVFYSFFGLRFLSFFRGSRGVFEPPAELFVVEVGSRASHIPGGLDELPQPEIHVVGTRKVVFGSVFSSLFKITKIMKNDDFCTFYCDTIESSKRLYGTTTTPKVPN